MSLGVAVALWTLVVHALGYYSTDIASGLIADQLALILPIVAVALALRERKRARPSAPLTLGLAIRTGVGTGVVSLPITIGFMWVYHHMINPGWLDALTAHERKRLTDAGVDSAGIERAVAALQRNGADGAQVVGAIVGTVLVTLVLSLVVWGVMRLLGHRSIRDGSLPAVTGGPREVPDTGQR
ncbi:MAG: DUF4199 domain-containing protein [Gemmatimonadaceae bacterium]